MTSSETESSGLRIAHDVAVATGQHLELRLRHSHRGSSQDQWWECETYLDGHRVGAFGVQFISEGEDLVFDLAEHLQDHFSGSTWDGWPKCPDHENHSLEPMLVNSKAVWQAQRAGSLRQSENCDQPSIRRIGAVSAGDGQSEMDQSEGAGTAVGCLG